MGGTGSRWVAVRIGGLQRTEDDAEPSKVVGVGIGFDVVDGDPQGIIDTDSDRTSPTWQGLGRRGSTFEGGYEPGRQSLFWAGSGVELAGALHRGRLILKFRGVEQSLAAGWVTPIRMPSIGQLSAFLDIGNGIMPSEEKRHGYVVVDKGIAGDRGEVINTD